MAGFDEKTMQGLREQGINPNSVSARPLQNMPYNTAGIPGLIAYNTPELEDTNARGFVFSDNRIKELQNNRALSPNVFVRPSAPVETVGHETEHLLARQNLGHPALINDKFDELSGNWRNRHTFVEEAINAAPYLKEKYGIDNAYFDPDYLKQGGTSRVLYEQLATLAGVEATQKVDLTKDPVLRKTLFKDRDIRETYNALTGLRQTRLDAKDLPPYTRQPETSEPGIVDKVKKLLGFANGGHVEHAGRKKDIF